VTRRGRWAKLPDVTESPPQPAQVPRIVPVVLTLEFAGIARTVDFSDLPCPRLVRCLALGVERYAGVGGALTTWASAAQVVPKVAAFVNFVAAVEQDDDLGPEDLEADHVDEFERTLLARHPRGSSQPQVVLSGVIRVLRHAHDVSPGAFDEELVARIAYGPRASRRANRPLDAYPAAVFEAIRDAALSDVRAMHQRMVEGEQIAATGQDPEIGGWRRLENLLWLVANRRALTAADNRRLGTTVSARLGGIQRCNRHFLLAMHDVLPFLVAVICLTGMEPEAVKRLTADCLINPVRGFVSIRYVKRRAHGHEVKQLRVADGGTLNQPGGLLRMALRLTQLGRDRCGSGLLWVYHGQASTQAVFDRDLNPLTWSAEGWMAEHGLDQLVDVDGNPVRLDLRRLRKSVKSQQYLKAAGVLADFAQGHTTQVAAEHYADIGAHTEIHDQAVEAGLREALAVALPPPVVLDDDGTLLAAQPACQPPPAVVSQALGRDNDVFLASCTDFYDSPFGTRGKPCPVAIWGCLECPNAVFMARHLPQVLTFLDFIERQRDELPDAEWNLRYGLAWQRIVHGIRNRFRTDQIRTAQTIAESSGARLFLPPEFGGQQA
jgi:hypothetical protein